MSDATEREYLYESFNALQFGLKLDRFIEFATMLFTGVGAVAAFLMMIIGSADILAIEVFKNPIPAAFESTETLLVLVIFGGLAYAARQKKHFRVELLTMRFPAKARQFVDLCSCLLGLVFFLLLSWQSVKFFLESWAVREATPNIISFPIYPSKFVMLLGSLLMCLQLLSDIVKSIYSLTRSTTAP